MKFNFNIFLKKNFLFAGFILFAYLIYSINNNNFYESFIISIILILGYLLIKYKIFYILLLLIIVSNLFFYFNKLIEGNTEECPHIGDSIKDLVTSQRREIKSSLTNTPNSDYYLKLDQERAGETAKQAAMDNEEFYGSDELKPRIYLSKDCAKKMTNPKVHIPIRQYETSICPQPVNPDITSSSVKEVSVEPEAAG